MDEAGLIRSFVDMTGQSESSARSVVMYLEILARDYFPRLSGDSANPETHSTDGSEAFLPAVAPSLAVAD